MRVACADQFFRFFCFYAHLWSFQKRDKNMEKSGDEDRACGKVKEGESSENYHWCAVIRIISNCQTCCICFVYMKEQLKLSTFMDLSYLSNIQIPFSIFSKLCSQLHKSSPKSTKIMLSIKWCPWRQVWPRLNCTLYSDVVYCMLSLLRASSSRLTTMLLFYRAVWVKGFLK